jgi:DNA-3-methyladenine glycosylase II
MTTRSVSRLFTATRSKSSSGVSAFGGPARRFEIEVRGPFSLAAAAGFLRGFTPAAGSSAEAGDRLQLAFRLDGTFAPVGVSLRQEGDRVCGALTGSAAAAVARDQVARILSLDHDGAGWAALGAREPVVGELQANYPGLRPVCFASPYEAGVWGLLAHRLRMPQAAALRRRLAEAHGAAVTVDGTAIPTLPAPADLLKVNRLPGLPDEKMARLHALAEAARAGHLDAARLRALPVDQALADLARLPGVGPWTAGHILLRGAAVADAPAFAEPRVVRAVARAYRLAALPGEAECETIAEGWRPFRTWVAVLLAVHLKRTGDWSEPGDRARRGRPRRGRS